MATIKQKRAAKLLIDNLQAKEPLTGGEIVVNSGYGVSMKKNPQVILESEGVKEELITVYGFDPDRAKQVVGRILEEGEENNQLKAADMIFKVHSTYAPEKSINLNVNRAENTKLDALIEKLENELDQQSTGA